jgi:endoglucanase
MIETKNIRGVNLGGWLLMEGYILGGDNIPETAFKNAFKKEQGAAQLAEFEGLFRDNFIRESDFQKIRAMGANTVRLPFHYLLIERRPYVYSSKGFAYLEKAFSWAKKNSLKIILDLHAACGAQNCDWHADSLGQADLWSEKRYRQRTVALWGAIAERFYDQEALLGYDILNEPVLGAHSSQVLKTLYKDIIRSIRAADKKHTIFLEGALWAQQIDFLEELIGDQVSLSIHTYQPLDYVFNFLPFGRFPGKINGCFWGHQKMCRYLEPYYAFSRKHKVGIFVGEFGINWRGGFWGEEKWLAEILKVFSDFDFGYTYWTYKAVAQYLFPDGLYQKIDNPPYVNRQGPLRGWETYKKYWPGRKKDWTNFFRTDTFSLNRKLTKILSEYFRK